MLSSQSAAQLRFSLVCLKLQPALASSYPTTAPATTRRFTSSSTYHLRPTISTATIPHPQPTRQPIRHASTTTSPTTSPTSQVPSPSRSQPTHPSPPTTSEPHPLTWNSYLTLRRTRRHYNLIASLTSSLLTTGAGASYISALSLDSLALFGLDPIMVMGLAVVGSGGVGWLLGPFVGERVFGWRYRRIRGEMGEKEQDLYRRIKKHRVDPSGGSSANPVPDYYGEKIGSVQGYRNWMKDQRAFNKKRQNFL